MKWTFSRVEYYFADFLSVLELDPENQAIKLMPVSTTGKLPKNLCNGCSVKIPQNTWFIGTANKDDSTFTITDKVYDRESVIDFVNRSTPTVSNFNVSPANESSLSDLDSIIKCCILVVDASKDIYSRMCLVCGSSFIEETDDGFLCEDCGAYYSFLNPRRVWIRYFNTLPNKN